MNKDLTQKDKKKEKRNAKRILNKEREMRRFIRDFTKEDAFYRFMKKYSLSKEQALKKLAELNVVVKKEQKDFAIKKLRVIKQVQKEKRKRRQLKKQRRREEEAHDMFQDEVVNHFLDTGEVGSIEEYLIIKDEFF